MPGLQVLSQTLVNEPEMRLYAASWRVQYTVNLQRCMLAQLRNPCDAAMRLIVCMWVGLVIGDPLAPYALLTALYPRPVDSMPHTQNCPSGCMPLSWAVSHLSCPHRKAMSVISCTLTQTALDSKTKIPEPQW